MRSGVKFSRRIIPSGDIFSSDCEVGSCDAGCSVLLLCARSSDDFRVTVAPVPVADKPLVQLSGGVAGQFLVKVD